jgi:hypothetical protein
MSATDERIIGFFKYEQMRPGSDEHTIAEGFSITAHRILSQCPACPERTLALRSLLDARANALRAIEAGPLPWGERPSGRV